MVQRDPRGDVVIETWEGMLVAFDTELTPELVAEGHARELISRLQRLRKESGLEVTDRIAVRVATEDADLRAAFEAQRDYARSRYTYVVNALRLKQAAGTLGEDDIREVDGWLAGE